MATEFSVHRLNKVGLAKADRLAKAFETCLDDVKQQIPPGRELALVVTKMQEAAFFAKRAMALQPENQEG